MAGTFEVIFLERRDPGPGAISRAVRLLSRSDITHVAIRDETGRIFSIYFDVSKGEIVPELPADIAERVLLSVFKTPPATYKFDTKLPHATGWTWWRHGERSRRTKQGRLRGVWAYLWSVVCRNDCVANAKWALDQHADIRVPWWVWTPAGLRNFIAKRGAH